MMRRVLVCLTVLVLALMSSARAEDGLRLFAAGSLTGAMTAMLAASRLPPHQIAAPVFGPSSVLREMSLSTQSDGFSVVFDHGI